MNDVLTALADLYGCEPDFDEIVEAARAVRDERDEMRRRYKIARDAAMAFFRFFLTIKEGESVLKEAIEAAEKARPGDMARYLEGDR